MSAFTISIKLEILDSEVDKRERDIIYIQIGDSQSLSLFKDDMNLLIGNPNESTKEY